MESQKAPIVITTIPRGFKLVLTAPFQYNTSQLQAEIEKVVAARPKVIEFDIAAVELLSTVGLGILVNLHNSAQASGGVLKIVSLRKRTLGILHTAKLDELLRIDPSAVVDPDPAE